MSLDVYLSVNRPEVIFEANITHNLNIMAAAAGIYQHLWRPEELGITKASQLITPLCAGLTKLKENPDEYRKLEPENGWGKYDHFVPWLEKYLAACIENPDADIRVSR